MSQVGRFTVDLISGFSSTLLFGGLLVGESREHLGVDCLRDFRVWLDKGTFKEVSVTAELPGTGLWAKTTAKPVSLHLEPGTTDAETFPSSGECEINADGSIGTPYAGSDAQSAPPCGITYLRASNAEPYQLKASVAWEISWQGAGGTKGDLPDGTFDTTQNMVVQEIQATNR